MSDALLILRAEAFLAEEVAREAKSERFFELPLPWSVEDRREYESLNAENTRYHERLEAISTAAPTTRDGLLAQAKVALWHFNHMGGDGVHGWNLAESVLRVHGEPVPDWAVAEGEPGQ